LSLEHLVVVAGTSSRPSGPGSPQPGPSWSGPSGLCSSPSTAAPSCTGSCGACAAPTSPAGAIRHEKGEP